MTDACYERAKSGDTAAVSLLVEFLRPRLTKMACYYARQSGEDPDDLLQEAWIGLLEALPTLNVRIGSPEQYLIQRARWRLLDSIKRAVIRRCESIEDGITEPSTDDNDSVEKAFVSEFVGQLKSAQRAVLDCLLMGFTWREAGSVLGYTSANVAYYVRQIKEQYLNFIGE